MHLHIIRSLNTIFKVFYSYGRCHAPGAIRTTFSKKIPRLSKSFPNIHILLITLKFLSKSLETFSSKIFDCWKWHVHFSNPSYFKIYMIETNSPNFIEISFTVWPKWRNALKFRFVPSSLQVSFKIGICTHFREKVYKHTYVYYTYVYL